MEGSGFTDVLLESYLASSGSLHGVLTGKNYSRATYCHKTVLEALHRLLMLEFIEARGDILIEIAKLDEYNALLLIPSDDNLSKFLKNELVCTFLDGYVKFVSMLEVEVLVKLQCFG